jgi:hypothetical protein
MRNGLPAYGIKPKGDLSENYKATNAIAILYLLVVPFVLLQKENLASIKGKGIMVKTRSTEKTTFWPYGAVIALVAGYIVIKLLSGKRVSQQINYQKVPTCERCHTNTARVHIDHLHEGRRESLFLCLSCADELKQMNAEDSGEC